MPPIEAVLIGAGQRGHGAMGGYALRNPRELKFIAVAEPDEDRRKIFARDHNIPPENCFDSYDELFARPRLAPLCFNATLDKTHLPSSLPALKKGYHLYLEKPMADTPRGCLKIVDTAMKYKRMVQICHPLRYTAFYKKIKDLLEEGVIGQIISFSMYENVGYWHFAHSFVRGNWGRRETSGPMILTKCCHDMDIATWLTDSRVWKVSSFGTLNYFRKKNAPAGAPTHCLDGCPAKRTCPFYVVPFYLGSNIEWPVSVISTATSLRARRKALTKGPYGRCVFRCDNTVCDNQVVDAQFENGVTLNFAVRANSFRCFRTIRIIGTEGELNGHMEKNEISTIRFGQNTGEKEKTRVINTAIIEGGHGGGDTGAIRNFLRCYRENDYKGIKHSLEIALEGHLLAFAAEEAREKEQVVELEKFRNKVRRTTKARRAI